MKLSPSICCILQRKVATLLLVSASLAAFATLGEGGKKSLPRNGKNLLSARSAAVDYKSFSLRSGYAYRGSKLLSNTSGYNNYILLNKVVTMEKGNQTFIVPMKRKVLIDRINFKPTAVR